MRRLLRYAVDAWCCPYDRCQWQARLRGSDTICCDHTDYTAAVLKGIVEQRLISELSMTQDKERQKAKEKSSDLPLPNDKHAPREISSASPVAAATPASAPQAVLGDKLWLLARFTVITFPSFHRTMYLESLGLPVHFY